MVGNSQNEPFRHLREVRYISLTTYYSSGKEIATPVTFAEVENKLYISTDKNSWKVKRIRKNNHGKIAPCTVRGKVLEPNMAINIRILEPHEEELAKEALRQKYNDLLTRLIPVLSKLVFWRKPSERVFLELTWSTA
ncbi:MAG: PPOX class F420-dependent oxidoreductase [Candidatus Hermodarchaeota archaeon]